MCGKAAQNTHHNHLFLLKEFSERTTKNEISAWNYPADFDTRSGVGPPAVFGAILCENSLKPIVQNPGLEVQTRLPRVRDNHHMRGVTSANCRVVHSDVSYG